MYMNDDLDTACRVEEIRILQWCSEANTRLEADLKASHRKLAAIGKGSGRQWYTEGLNIIFASVESIIKKALALRKELGLNTPDLYLDPNLKNFQNKMDQIVDGAVGNVQCRFSQPASLAGAEMELLRRANERASALKAKVKNELEALPLEAKIGTYRKVSLSMSNTFNISNLANLNLGTVIGDLNGSIQTLENTGHDQLVRALRELIEGIGASTDLDDNSKKELLEHVSLLSGEVALPAEKRKMGLLKTSITALQSGLVVATQLWTLWQGVAQILKDAGMPIP